MANRLRIAILDDYLDKALSLADWGALDAEIAVFKDPIAPALLAETLAPFDVICVMRERTPFPGDLIRALPRLKLLVTSGPRNAAIDLKAATACGVIVSGTESRKAPTAQLTMTLILAANRRLIAETSALRDGGWQHALGRDLDGLTLGLVGLGKLGEEMARLGKAFGMTCVAWSQNLTPARCAEVGVGYAASLQELMRVSDTVSIHLVLSDRSRGLIDAEAIDAMKPDAVLVNTSRGPIVDTAALLAALREGRVGAAGIDVFDTEPLPLDDPLRDPELIDSGRLVLTPHIGYGSEQTFRIFYTQMVEAIVAWKAGAPIRALAGG